MSIKPERFRFALERLMADDWKKFEQFASAFLVPDYPELRTVASASGDLGRDATLFSPTGEETVAFQFSVTPKWKDKIKQTADRLKKEVPTVIFLIYVTNQEIGAKADAFKQQMRKSHNILVDIYDCSWFLDRFQHSKSRMDLASNLASEIVDPYLQSREVIETRATALSAYEAKAAVVYLSLQWEDDTREKGLTKLCFEALVKAALRETNSERRMTREAVKIHVRGLMPNHSHALIDAQVDGALERLDKKSIRHYKHTNELSLTADESAKVKEHLTTKETKDALFRDEISSTVLEESKALNGSAANHLSALSLRVRRVIETYLLRLGERFAAQVHSGSFDSSASAEMSQIVASDIALHKDTTGLGAKTVEITSRAALIVLISSSEAVQHYMRSLADAYTLFAFLKETPDVQEVAKKLFSYGEIWLDTSILLPAFAETLLLDEEQNITRLLSVAHEAGLTLHVTEGVIEELEKHIHRCLACARGAANTWHGRLPFLYSMFALSGRGIAGIGRWMNTFCGEVRPTDDLVDYLREKFHIQRGSLFEYAKTAPQNLQHATDKIWHEAHEERRNRFNNEIDPMLVNRLVRHDVENFLGTIQKRHQVANTGLGYTVWWLTFDKTVKGIENKLRNIMGENVPKTPVMSPDFLLNYLAFGPVRAKLKKSAENNLPVTLESILPDELPDDLLELANNVREECKNMEERLVRRKLRDALDAAKTRSGVIAQSGFAGVEGQIRTSLEQRR